MSCKYNYFERLTSTSGPWACVEGLSDRTSTRGPWAFVEGLSDRISTGRIITQNNRLSFVKCSEQVFCEIVFILPSRTPCPLKGSALSFYFFWIVKVLTNEIWQRDRLPFRGLRGERRPFLLKNYFTTNHFNRSSDNFDILKNVIISESYDYNILPSRTPCPMFGLVCN